MCHFLRFSLLSGQLASWLNSSSTPVLSPNPTRTDNHDNGYNVAQHSPPFHFGKSLLDTKQPPETQPRSISSTRPSFFINAFHSLLEQCSVEPSCAHTHARSRGHILMTCTQCQGYPMVVASVESSLARPPPHEPDAPPPALPRIYSHGPDPR